MKINHAPIHLTIENQQFEFEVVGEYHPQDEHHPEGFDLQHLYYLKRGDRDSTDLAGFLSFPAIYDEVVKQLKAMQKDGELC